MTQFYLKIHTNLSDKTLIVSDEFMTESDAETYKRLLAQLLASQNPRPFTKREVTSLGLELMICEEQFDEALLPITLQEAIPRLWGDFERIHEFVQEVIDGILSEQFSETETQ